MRPAHLNLPTSAARGAAPPTNRVEATGPVVVVGANGAGKSRLGAWIEFDGPQKSQVHRVAAQRSLSMPDQVSPVSIDVAESGLLVGVSNEHIRRAIRDAPHEATNYKLHNRWGGKPVLTLLSDYQLLLVYLFSEQFDEAIRYREAARDPAGRVEPTLTRLDRIKRLWERALPHRELVIGGGTIEAKPKGAAQAYRAAEMSDGERVAFYLIGHCLAAPTDSVIVIDEPEVHLHRAVQGRLWDEIERERSDCLFVYLTHDLDFAASRLDATKVWLKSYEAGRWDWEIVPETEGLPEEVLLTVLGSRKPVLFVEGDRGGLEHTVLGRVYPDWTVIPRNGCGQVISATTAFSALKERHNLECRGVVDLDYRSSQDVVNLRAMGVHALAVHEIENLLLVEDVLRAIAAHLGLDVNSTVSQVKDWVLAQLAADRDRIVSATAAQAIENALKRFNAKAQGEAGLQAAVNELTGNVDVAALYAEAADRVDTVVRDADYSGALRVYGNKGLARSVGRFFGLGGDGYIGLIKRLLATNQGSGILLALRAAAPELP